MASHDFDVLIVGSGLAGLSAALHLAPTHRVAVITKRQLHDGASAWAQGGIAAVLADGDSFGAHVEDTLVAGAGLCDLAATRFVVENAPDAIAWLQQLGVPFRWKTAPCTSRARAATVRGASCIPPTPPVRPCSAR